LAASPSSGNAAPVDTDPGEAQARRDARWAAHQARSRRAALKFQLALVPLWVAIAVVWWLDGDADPVARWLYTANAVLQLGYAAVLWRPLRRTRPAPGTTEAPGR
jgi:hypothetical protein